MEKLGITLPFHTYPLVVGADIDDMFRLMTLMDLGWKRAFGLQHNEVLGLDIGSSQVKIVQLHKHNGEYAVTAAGVVEIETNIDNNSQREENATKAICECLQSAGADTQMAVCGVSGPEVAVRYFKFPCINVSDNRVCKCVGLSPAWLLPAILTMKVKNNDMCHWHHCNSFLHKGSDCP